MRVAGVPLLLAYAAYPLATHAQRLAGVPVMRNWIDAVWLAAALTAFLCILARRRLPGSRAAPFLALALLSLLCLPVVLRFMPQVVHGLALTPWLMEAKPLFYLGVSLLWFAAFGAPRPETFIRYGALLAALVLAEFAIASALAGELARPFGSGEVNYDACLLLISLVMGLYAVRAPLPVTAILFAGVAATFSRTGLAAAAAVFLFAPGRGVLFKCSAAIASAALLVLVFLARDLPLDAVEQLDRLIMWNAGLDLLVRHPAQALTGFAPGLALPVRVPESLSGLWELQQSAWGLSGVFAYNFHSFWLRSALTWGLAAQAAMLAALGYAACRFRQGPMRGLAVMALVMGMTMGLFYLSNVAVPLYLAFAVGHRPNDPECAACDRV